jgi:hypothetical protein
MKAKYRKAFMQTISLLVSKQLQQNILQAYCLVAAAWQSGNSDYLASCFSKVEFHFRMNKWMKGN